MSRDCKIILIFTGNGVVVRAISAYPVMDEGVVATDAAGYEYFLHIVAIADAYGQQDVNFGVNRQVLDRYVPAVHNSVFVPWNLSGRPSEDIICIQQPVQLAEYHVPALHGIAQVLGIEWCYGIDRNGFLDEVDVVPSKHDLTLPSKSGQLVFPGVRGLSIMLAGLRAQGIHSIYAQN